MSDLITFDRMKRTWVKNVADATLSDVSIRGLPSAYRALEDYCDPGGPKIWGERAIPAGRYLLALYESPKFADSYYTKDDKNLIARKDWEKLGKWERNTYHAHDLIWVQNVPDYQYILLHWGNTAADSAGCGLIGSTFGKIGNNAAVLNSRKAYVDFYAEVAPSIRKGGQHITYKNSFTLAP